MKRLLISMTLTLSAAGCGGVSVGSADGGPTDGDHRADAEPTDGDDRTDSGAGGGETDAGPDGDLPDGGGAGIGMCVLGTSELGNCSL